MEQPRTTGSPMSPALSPHAPGAGLRLLSSSLHSSSLWYAPRRISRSGLVLVALAHAALLWALLQHLPTVETPAMPVLSVSLLTSAPSPSPHQNQPAPQAESYPSPPPQQKPRPHAPLLSTAAPMAHPNTQPPPAEISTPLTPPDPATSPAETTASSHTNVSAPASPQPPRFDAAYLDNPRPAYPLLSRRMGEQGRVVLQVQVDAQGKPGEVRIHRSSGSTRLDNAAHEAVQRWRFVPARLGNETIAASVLVPIDFSLKD